jgi:hypothetical protein
MMKGRAGLSIKIAGRRARGHALWLFCSVYEFLIPRIPYLSLWTAHFAQFLHF